LFNNIRFYLTSFPIKYFPKIIRKSGPGLRESILQQLSQLVTITAHHITEYLPAIVDILSDFWMIHLEYVLAIVQQVAIKTTEAFSAHLPKLLPLLLSSICIPKGVLENPSEQSFKPLEQVFICHKTLREGR